MPLISQSEAVSGQTTSKHGQAPKYSSPDQTSRMQSSKTMLGKYLEKKKTMISSESIGNLLARNKTPRSVIRLNEKRQSVSKSFRAGNHDALSMRRKKTLLFKDSSRNSLDQSLTIRNTQIVKRSNHFNSRQMSSH